MTDSSKATLGGYDLLARQPVGWSFIDGVRPSKQIFELVAEDAQSLIGSLNGNGDSDPGITLKIEVQGGETLQVDRLYPIQIVPTDNPYTLGVLVVDRRFWWGFPYTHFARAYNVRRRFSPRRLTIDGGPTEIQAVVPSVGYAPWSLLFPPDNQPGSGDNGTIDKAGSARPWEAIDILTDVLNFLVGDEYVIDPNVLHRKIPVEGLQLDYSGDQALARILSFLSGAAVSIDPDGTVRVRDARDGSETDLLDAAEPTIAGSPLAAIVSHRLVRPNFFNVLFTREFELRYDFADDAPAPGATPTSQAVPQKGVDTRSLNNVAPVPDQQITIPSNVPGRAGRTLITGAWCDLDDLFAAWTSDMQPGQTAPITKALIKQGWFTPGFLQAMILGTDGIVKPVLARRLATAFGHLRQTFQIDRQHLDRICSLKAERTLIIDPVTGTRGTSPVYCDWTALYPNRGGIGPAGGFFLNDTHVGWAPLLANAKRAPFLVSVLDEDQGIIHVEPRMPLRGSVVAVIPGGATGPDGKNRPSADPRQGKPGGFGTLQEQLQLGDFRMATVLSVTPGSPNDESRFHVVTVTTADVEKVLGISLGACDGPPATLRVGPDIVRARFGWDDANASAIDAALTVPLPDDKQAAAQAAALNLLPGNEEQLKFAAVAYVASVYAGLIDRGEGSVSTALNPTLGPRGSAGAISHALQPNGAAITTAAMPPEPPALDMISLMPESVTRKMLGLVDLKGQPRA